MKTYSLTGQTSLLVYLFSVSIFFITTSSIVRVNENENCTNVLSDSLPHVFNGNNGYLIESNLRHEAVLKFPLYQLPQNKHGWDTYRIQLKGKIIKKNRRSHQSKIAIEFKRDGQLPVYILWQWKEI